MFSWIYPKTKSFSLGNYLKTVMRIKKLNLQYPSSVSQKFDRWKSTYLRICKKPSKRVFTCCNCFNVQIKKKKVEQMEIANWFEGAQNSKNKHFLLMKGGIVTASSLSPFHLPLLGGDKWEMVRFRMKIYCDAVIRRVPAFSLQNNA